MTPYSQSRFDQFVIENGIIGFFDKAITLKSGRQSHFYVNWRQATNDAYLLDQLTDQIIAFIRNKGVDCDTIYGVPEGATKTAVIAGLKLAKQEPDFGKGSHVLAMGRAKPKAHGNPKDRDYIGQPQGRTLVLEDTITTGMSLIESLTKLKEHGVNVTHVLGITDRMEKRDNGQSVEEALKEQFGPDLVYLTMSQAPRLLPIAASRLEPSTDVKKALTDEFAEYGVEPLNWERRNEL